MKYNLPVVNPVDDEGKFTDTIWKGKFVMDADLDIIDWLRRMVSFIESKGWNIIILIVGDAILH